jgi:hypothetical protein
LEQGIRVGVLSHRDSIRLERPVRDVGDPDIAYFAILLDRKSVV